MRGKIGQNPSYLKPYSGRVCIDALKQAEVPTQVGADLRITVIVGGKGDQSYNGNYILTASEPFTWKLTGGSPATATIDGIFLSAKPDQTPQLHLLFPGRTTLPTGLRIIRPGYTVEQADTQVWTTEYIDLLKRLNTGCIRLMDIMRTNGSECTDSWCDRSEPLWGVKGRGAPLTELVRLAVTLDADVWFCAPQKATDAYVRSAAMVMRDAMPATSHVYVEYGNEMWNTDPRFTGESYCREQGAKIAATDNRWNALAPVTQGRWFSAKRASEIAAIFLYVFRGQEYRVVPMLAGCTADSFVLRDALAYGWKPKALATAGYFNSGTAPEALWAGTQIKKFNALADGYEKLIYEWTNVNANVIDPANGAMIEAWGNGAQANNISMACHFVPLAGTDSKYAATNEVATWTAKCEALAQLSAAHPHPYAEPPVDPKDAEINGLKSRMGVLQDELARADASLSAATSTIDKATAELNVLRAHESAIKRVLGVA